MTNHWYDSIVETLVNAIDAIYAKKTDLPEDISDLTDGQSIIPSASLTTPSADVSGGAIGSGTTWAKADHQHPLSSAYATSNHSHSYASSLESGFLTSSHYDLLTSFESIEIIYMSQLLDDYDISLQSVVTFDDALTELSSLGFTNLSQTLAFSNVNTNYGFVILEDDIETGLQFIYYRDTNSFYPLVEEYPVEITITYTDNTTETLTLGSKIRF